MDQRGRAAAHERGAGAPEYLGAVVVAVLLVVGLIAGAGGFGGQLSGVMSEAICRVGSTLGGDCEGSTSGEEAAIDYDPNTCLVSSNANTYEGEGTIVVVDLGAGKTGEIREIRNADGTVSYQVAISSEFEGGLSVAPGTPGADLGGGVGAGVEFEVGVGVSRGGTTVYEFTDYDQARAVLDGAASASDPLSESVVWGGHATITADAGLKLPIGDSEVGGPGVNFNFSGSHTYETITNANGTTTYLTTLSGELGGGVDAMTGGAELMGARDGAVSITRDANGQITQIELIKTEEFGGQGGLGGDVARNGADVGIGIEFGGTGVTVTTTTLVVTDANRDIVHTWLGDSSSTYAGLAKPWETMWGDVAATSSSDPFRNLLFQEAQITQNVLDVSTSEQELGGYIKFGMFRVGGEVRHTSVDGELVLAEHLGAPSAGQRGWETTGICQL